MNTALFINGLMGHVVADWFLQNEWIAINKTKATHIAGWLHAFAHYLMMSLFFSQGVAALIALSHWFIDLRFGLVWYRKMIGQTTQGEFAIHVALWQDQAAHLVVIWLAAMFC